MEISLSDASARVLLHDAHATARRTCRRLGLAAHEVEDVSQDLIVDLLARLPAYRPSRGSLGAFANVVFRNKASRISAAIRRERMSLGLLLSIDEPLDALGTTLRESLPECSGYAAMLGQRADHDAQALLRISTQTGLKQVFPEHRRLVDALSETTVEALARQGGRARSTLYRDLQRVRLDLVAAGIGALR